MAIFFLSYLCEKNRVYTEKDLRLTRVDNPNDNTYYFQIRLSLFQYRKKEEIKKRYSQNSIIYCEEDNSYHKVLRWGANVQGIQRIIVEPYIIEEIIPNVNCTVYISNYGSLYIDVFEPYCFNELYKEILKLEMDISKQEKDVVLKTLKDIEQKKVVNKNSLESLCKFLEKYNILFSYASDVLSIISSIIELMS